MSYKTDTNRSLRKTKQICFARKDRFLWKVPLLASEHKHLRIHS